MLPTRRQWWRLSRPSTWSPIWPISSSRWRSVFLPNEADFIHFIGFIGSSLSPRTVSVAGCPRFSARWHVYPSESGAHGFLLVAFVTPAPSATRVTCPAHSRCLFFISEATEIKKRRLFYFVYDVSFPQHCSSLFVLPFHKPRTGPSIGTYIHPPED